MVNENDAVAYLGPSLRMGALARWVLNDPNFDVFDGPGRRLLLGKCSRLPDDEDQGAGRFGIDFHRGLPPFQEASGFTCDWGQGPIPVNAYTYAYYLPMTLRFREFTANLAFAALDRREYQTKRRVYEDFYHYLYQAPCPTVVAVPHAGEVRRPPDNYHPFPQSETDAWTARVAAHCLNAPPAEGERLLISLHSTDYFGAFLDLGDFGLPQNCILPCLIDRLNQRFHGELAATLPAYRDYLVPYTLERLRWMEARWGTLDPEALKTTFTASRFEILSLIRVLEKWLPPAARVTAAWLAQGFEAFFASPPRQLITLNHVFSGRKTAGLLNLADNLAQAGFFTAVQVECSRFLARQCPETIAAVLSFLEQELRALAPAAISGPGPIS
ncbi:MAG: hypothetical protein ACUVXF_12370 [Desulfobaccales bacterium]